MKTPHPIPADIMNYLRYDEETGKLFWTCRVNPLGDDKTGQEAGGLNSWGHVVVTFRRRRYCAHRIIYFAKTGENPPQVDHRDLDPSNNRFSNLRAATHSQNTANRRGWGALYPKGVGKSGSKFFGKITWRWKRYYLGTFDTADEAHAAYVAAAARLHGEFARAD